MPTVSHMDYTIAAATPVRQDQERRGCRFSLHVQVRRRRSELLHAAFFSWYESASSSYTRSAIVSMMCDRTFRYAMAGGTRPTKLFTAISYFSSQRRRVFLLGISSPGWMRTLRV